MQSKRKIPQRRCVGCREMKDKVRVLRIVCNADGEISIDRSGKAHGRGAYVCQSTGCLDMAIKSKGLERSFKRAVPQEIYETLKTELER